MRRILVIVLLLALAALLPAQARAGCAENRGADRLFAHPYGEPNVPCPEQREIDASSELRALEHEELFEEPRGGRQLQTMGITGMSTGASFAGLGGVSFLMSRFFEQQTVAAQVMGKGGLGLAVLGGALFLAGATMVGIDALAAPAPTPDGRGAQLTLAMRF